jgi:hypothetical protein
LEVRGSDDPEDLLEQANALRDSEDKVRQQMKALQLRIAEIHRERELDRRMSDFLGEERLFDEQDRRLRSASAASRTGSPTADTAAPGGVFSATASPGALQPTSATSATSSTSTASAGSGGAPSIHDSRPRVGGGDPVSPEGADLRELSALEEKLRKLESLVQQLDARASEIEARAREAR